MEGLSHLGQGDGVVQHHRRIQFWPLRVFRAEKSLREQGHIGVGEEEMARTVGATG